MGKYSIDNLIRGYGDHDFESKYQGSAIVYLLEKIANELAEGNELKRNELNFTIKEFMESPLKDEA